MYVKGREREYKDLGGGVLRKVLAYSANIMNVELEFEHEALVEIARKTLQANTGARGLRTIMEEALMPIMYNMPSDYEIEKVLITKDYILGESEAEYVKNPDREPVKLTKPAPKKRKSGGRYA